MWPPPPIKLKMLIAIAILPLLLSYAKQTSAQETTTKPANGILYGLGGYKMDDTEQQMVVPEYALLLKTAEDVKKYKTNNHTDTQFKPCRVERNVGSKFEVFYDEDTANEGCTVDFVMDKIDEINTDVKVNDTRMGCLEDCGSSELVAMSKNLVPFTYSLSNDEFKKLHNGPPYNEDQKLCNKKKLKCTEKSGKCFASSTSLQLALTKCAEKTAMARAWILLVGEPVYGWGAEIKVQPGENNEAIFQFFIKMGDNPNFPGNKVPLVTIKGPDGGGNTFPDTSKQPYCFLDNKMAMIPELKFWKIKSDNAELSGKHLLVFHLLPQNATRIFDNKGILQNPPEPGMPNCKGKLSIIFRNAVGILQSVPPSTTENTDGNLTPSTNNETTAAGGIDTTLIIAIAAGGAVLVLVIVALLVWCLCCRNKEKDDSDEENEDKEKADEEANQDYALFEKDAAAAKNEKASKGVHVEEGVRVPETVEQGEYE